ncbi:hypothetical protein CAGGBEG34_30003 [Candidatus Glomeribacter gigasporarum BEG34]|uniref:PAS domain-containing protein n=1 Tax=Candidatus Glomeribacter gigasporarum BEG34 TaxID=1070319 RepID=G2JB93_9BURK|nr:hypothetical protein [Candidatus Glomeribacter gigasporarum]CCD30046.1 hypothetical protein CAGGBEG34_30003 [Candidatus Glomeribacter gigasporarum BEG34]
MNIEFNGLRQSKGPLYYAGTALSDLIEESSDQMLLKDVQTGKYLLCSPLTATLLGVKVNDLIGLTIDDLAARDGIWSQWDFSPQFIVWKNKEPEVIKRLDHQVQATQHPVSRCHVTFTHEGFIRFKQTVKRPVFNRNTHKVIAVLSFAKI